MNVDVVQGRRRCFGGGAASERLLLSQCRRPANACCLDMEHVPRAMEGSKVG